MSSGSPSHIDTSVEGVGGVLSSPGSPGSAGGGGEGGADGDGGGGGRAVLPLTTFEVGVKGELRAMALSPDGRWLAVGTKGIQVGMFRWEPDALSAMDVASRLAAGTAHEVLSGKWVADRPLRTRDGDTQVLEFSPTGLQLLVGSSKPMSDVEVYSWEEDRLGWAPTGRLGEIRSLRGCAFNSTPWRGPAVPASLLMREEGEEWMVTWAKDRKENERKLRLYFRDASGRWKWRQSLDHGCPVIAAVFAPWGSAMLSAGEDGVLRLWRIGEDAARVGVGGRAGAWEEVAAWSVLDGSATGLGVEGSAQQRRKSSKKLLKERGKSGSLASIPTSPSSPSSLSPPSSPTSSGTRSPPVRATAIAFSPCGEVVALGVSGKGVKYGVRIFQVVQADGSIPTHLGPTTAPNKGWTLNPLRRLKGPKGKVNALYFSPDAKWLAVASKDLRFFKVANLKPAPGLEPTTTNQTSAKEDGVGGGDGGGEAEGGGGGGGGGEAGGEAEADTDHTPLPSPSSPSSSSSTPSFRPGVRLSGYTSGPLQFVPPAGVWLTGACGEEGKIRVWRLVEAERKIAASTIGRVLQAVVKIQACIRRRVATRKVQQLKEGDEEAGEEEEDEVVEEEVVEEEEEEVVEEEVVVEEEEEEVKEESMEEEKEGEEDKDQEEEDKDDETPPTIEPEQVHITPSPPKPTSPPAPRPAGGKEDEGQRATTSSPPQQAPQSGGCCCTIS